MKDGLGHAGNSSTSTSDAISNLLMRDWVPTIAKSLHIILSDQMSNVSINIKNRPILFLF